MSHTTTLTVSGMTCDHCTSAVRSELLELDGVTAVDIDLVGGGASPVSITSETELDREQVAAAIQEAGDYLITFP